MLGTLLSGCPLAAADVSGDSSITTVDVIAIQPMPSRLGPAGSSLILDRYQFTPQPAGQLSGLCTNQYPNYGALILGDVSSSVCGRDVQMVSAECECQGACL